MNKIERRITNKDGFTLIELMVALGIGIFMMMAIYGVINHAQRSTSGIERKVGAQADARSALELMAMEIRMASYNQFSTTGNWLNITAPNACIGAAGTQTWKGIQEATPFSITVEMDINDNCTINGNPVCMKDADEVIRYRYVNDKGNGDFYIARSSNCGAEQAFLGDLTASGNPKTVRVINDLDADGENYDPAKDIPVFRYFNGQGAEILPASLPASIPDIRRIEITLVVETENIDPNTGVRRRMTYSSSVIPRNHLPSLN